MPGGHWDELPGVFVLFSHYQEHQDCPEEESVSFMEFMAMHYGKSASQQAHEHEEDHSKLPFNHVCSSPLIAILSFFRCEFKLREISFEKVFSVPVFIPRIHIADILQPPR